jgi:preprotein translocase subunit SecF
MMNLVGKRKWFFLISAVVIIPGLLSLIIFGLKPGVDFSSGTTMTLRFDSPVDQADLRRQLIAQGYDSSTVQRTGEGDFFIRLGEMTPDQRQELIESLESTFKTNITVRDFYAVSPVIATETARNATIAVGVAAIFMLFYIAWAFRRMPKPYRWGICAIVALLHDVLVVMGVFSILGWLAGVQIDAMFITGMLTVVGYSVNNTVVVFDRIRENVSKGIGKDFESNVNASIFETVARSLNTSLTTLLVILAILLFGGITIRYFVLVLLIGVIAGTYSSMLIAGPLLVVWDKGGWRGFFSWLPFVKKTT